MILWQSMRDLLGYIPVAVLAGISGWVGKVILEGWRSRSERYKTDLDVNARLEEHRDDLTFKLPEAARQDIAIWRQDFATIKNEMERLKPFEAYVLRFEQALMHIEQLLYCPSDQLPKVRKNAEIFYKRMKRLQEAKGTVLNEDQTLKSAENLRRREEGREPID